VLDDVSWRTSRAGRTREPPELIFKTVIVIFETPKFLRSGGVGPFRLKTPVNAPVPRSPAPVHEDVTSGSSDVR